MEFINSIRYKNDIYDVIKLLETEWVFNIGKAYMGFRILSWSGNSPKLYTKEQMMFFQASL